MYEYGSRPDPSGIEVLFFIFGIIIIILELIMLWVAKDSYKRKMNWILWPYVSIFILFPIGLIVYFSSRKNINGENKSDSKSKICPFCGEEIKREALVCKFCKSDIK